MPNLTGEDIALVIAAVAGAGVGFAGTAFVNWRQDRRAASASQTRAIEEAFAAADDLLAAVLQFRSFGGANAFKPTAAGGMRASLKTIRPHLHDIAHGTFNPWLATVDSVTEILSEFAPGGVVSHTVDNASAKYLAFVARPRQRLSAALAALRLAPEKALADAAEGLARAARHLANCGVLPPERHYKEVSQEFEEAIHRFRMSAQRPRRRRPFRTAR